MKTKILAISMVALMMLSGLFVLGDLEGNDAAIGNPADLYGMGQNTSGQQGDGTTTNVTTPTQIGSSLGTISDVVCSYSTTYFLIPSLTDVTFTTVDADTYNGSLSANSIADVNIGSTITVSGNTVTIDGTTITATTADNTAQYTYGVTWSVEDGDTVTSDMTITATFTRSVNNYAVSVTADPAGYGTVSAASFPSVPYGSSITIGASTITIGEDTITATPEADTSEYDYGFDGFYIGDVKLVGGETVTGVTAVTAKFTRTNLYTVTIESSDVDKGTVSPTELTSVPDGTQISASGNTLTVGSETVTATPADGYRVNWQIPSDTVTGDVTITADFELIPTEEQVLLSMIPLIIIFAIIMLAASALMTFRGDGFDMIKLIIGLTICILVTVTVLLPAAGII